MIQLKNVSKFYYSKGMIASGISKINLEFGIGEFVVITGESGSGKTTLLNVISGLDTYEEGEMYIEGRETSHYLAADFEEYRKKYIGNIFQSFNLVNSYTVYQNIELILRINGYRRADMKERIAGIIRRVGLEAYTRTKVSKLSGGQKQRVAIARALAKDTDIIVADEPTGNLDSRAAADIAELLSEISRDKLVIVVTHNYEQFAPYATRQIKMHDGKVAEDNIIRQNAPVQPAMNEQPAATSAAPADNRTRQSAENSTSASTASHQYAAKAAAPAPQRPAATGRISAGSMIRLGVRNTFNIVHKFLLLLVVFIFVVTAVTAQYTSYVKSDDEQSEMGYNEIFMNYSQDRIIVKKKDGSLFTKDDCRIISSAANVASIAENDILLDSSLYMEDKELFYDAYPHSVSEFSGSLFMGSMPEKANEVILAGSEDDSSFSEEMAEQMLGKTFKVYISDEQTMKFKITGLAYRKQDSSIYSSTGDIYIQDSALAKMRREVYSSKSTVTTTINGKEQTYIADSGYYYMLIPDSKVEKGKALMSEEANNFYENGDAKGKTIEVKAKNIYYQKKLSLEIADIYTDKNFQEKTSRKDYDLYNGAVFISQADYDSLFAKGNYQISVYVKSAKDKDLDQTKQTLESMGYTAMPLKGLLCSYGADLTSIIQVPVVVIVIVALFFIAYFVIRLILKSRTGYFSILRMLGLSRKKIRRILDIEMFMVASIAFAVFLAVILMVHYHIIHIEYMWSLAEYMNPIAYAGLYIVIVIMSYLISGKFIRSIFKKSAMGSFREGGR